MIKFTQKQLQQLKNADEAQRKEFAATLVDNYSASALAYTIIELLDGKETITPEKIAISKEQLNQIFRIKGEDGRGRKKKD